MKKLLFLFFTLALTGHAMEKQAPSLSYGEMDDLYSAITANKGQVRARLNTPSKHVQTPKAQGPSWIGNVPVQSKGPLRAKWNIPSKLSKPVQTPKAQGYGSRIFQQNNQGDKGYLFSYDTGDDEVPVIVVQGEPEVFEAMNSPSYIENGMNSHRTIQRASGELDKNLEVDPFLKNSLGQESGELYFVLDNDNDEGQLRLDNSFSSSMGKKGRYDSQSMNRDSHGLPSSAADQYCSSQETRRETSLSRGSQVVKDRDYEEESLIDSFSDVDLSRDIEAQEGLDKDFMLMEKDLPLFLRKRPVAAIKNSNSKVSPKAKGTPEIKGPEINFKPKIKMTEKAKILRNAREEDMKRRKQFNLIYRPVLNSRR